MRRAAPLHDVEMDAHAAASAPSAAGVPDADVGVVAAAAALAVLAIGQQLVVVARIAGRAVDIGVAPWIERERLGQVRASPFGLVAGSLDQGLETLLGHRKVADVEAISGQGLVEGVELGAGRL